MNKKEFFEELEEYLIGIPSDEKEEILGDYKEHFRMGKKKNRTDKEIIKSLGNPKQIAREMRNEISSSTKPELKSEAIETWVATKNFAKHLFEDAREKIGDVIQKDKKKKNDLAPTIILGALLFLAVMIIFDGFFLTIIALGIIGYLIYDSLEKKGKLNNFSKSKKTSLKKVSKKNKTSAPRVILCVLFNLLFFVWFWIGIFAGLVGLFIGSLAILISGTIITVFTLFTIFTHANPLTSDILYAGLFSGIGLFILGTLFVTAIKWVFEIYFRITRMYLQLNNRFIRK